jgi:hypothetical protein
MYGSIIGILLYATTTRPDIMQPVGLVAIFQSVPKETHMQAVKRNFRYLKGTLDFGLCYPKTKDFTLTAFTNADWAGSIDDRKSTIGGVFFLGKCLVSWISKKQPSISLSTTEVEYVAPASCCTQVIWMKQTLEDLQVKYDHSIILNSDNPSAIHLSKSLVMHSKTKHIPIKFHFLREHVTQKVVKVEYVDTKEQIADIFIKPLPMSTFEYLRQKLRVISISN